MKNILDQNIDDAFFKSEKNLKDAEVEVLKLLNAQPLFFDGKPVSGTLVIAYEKGDKSLQVEKLRQLSNALNTLANEYEAYPRY